MIYYYYFYNNWSTQKYNKQLKHVLSGNHMCVCYLFVFNFPIWWLTGKSIYYLCCDYYWNFVALNNNSTYERFTIHLCVNNICYVNTIFIMRLKMCLREMSQRHVRMIFKQEVRYFDVENTCHILWYDKLQNSC